MKFKFFLLVLIPFFIQCKQEVTTEKQSIKNELITDAEGISIAKYSNFSIVTIKNTFPEAVENYSYVLHKKGVQIPDSLKKLTSIEVPVKKIIVTSTTHIPSIEMLNMENSIIAFPNTNYISSEKTRQLINSGKIREIGNNQSLNTEVILDLQPDVMVGFSVDGDMKTYKNLERLGQKIILNSDWTEKTPLGKAEWIKFFGALYDKDAEAEKIYSQIKNDYNQAKQLATNSKTLPTIMAGSIYEDQWFLPQGDSWAAYFLNEAHSNYLWKDSKGTGSLSLSFESVLDKAKDADFWIGPGQFTSIEEILNANPNYTHFKAVRDKNVYSFSSKKGATGGVIYYELAPNRPDLVLKDLIKILHPEVLPNYELYFFEKLD
ncbi:ABC transporter substrate-binding protein [Flavobacterium haoranii]|uniref:Iron complex transport system substrate-binding protein n=3 Tax=Flavobacterium haoranii TaxID=683124 RepID=A0A1M6B9H5_9FLAO|nr:ABC transporter substrate-binding protein [Flavobacterium haoranii]SHI45362.1 iron complex transport system substrate-binding protein [Flavobacterium haoranii]